MQKKHRKLMEMIFTQTMQHHLRYAYILYVYIAFCRTPEQCPSLVSLLSESYNPHVRYGAAMALGIACAGTGIKESLSLLEPMVNDSVNYVRQGKIRNCYFI